NRKRPAATRRAGYRQSAAMTANNSHHSGQPQAAAGKLGRKEWIENPFPVVLVHPDACILNREAHVGAWPDVVGDDKRRRADELFIQILLTDADPHGAGFARGYRLTTVDDQVHHELVHLACI